MAAASNFRFTAAAQAAIVRITKDIDLVESRMYRVVSVGRRYTNVESSLH
jgi:hypothetical protein